MTTESAAKRDVQKLQRTIVDALQDVKAIDIQVFNTERLSSLFERVIMASGASNRQTRALAASVRDKVREAGYPKPRIEGEENGEWIIVDCGAAVAHIMQPAIRQYYSLEEIWGELPVRLKSAAVGRAVSGAPKTVARKTAKTPTPETQPAKTSKAAAPVTKPTKPAAAAKRTSAKAVPRKSPPAKAAKKVPAARRPVAKKVAPAKTTPAVKKATLKRKA